MKHSKRTILTVLLSGVLAIGLVPATALAEEGANDGAAAGLALASAVPASAIESSGDGITPLASNPLGPKLSREEALAAMSAFEDAYPRFTTVYDVTPRVTAPYRAGRLNSMTTDPALGYVNLVRYLAGLSHDVVTTEANNELAQAAAVVNAANGDLSHYPSRPTGMDDELYQLGVSGAASSNLSAGRSHVASAVTMGWLADPGDNNKADLGRRRWILYPNLSTTGFGFAESDTSSYRYFSAMITSSNYIGNTGTCVAWPAQTTPVQLVVGSDISEGYPWSFSVGRPIADPTAVKVSLTRVYDGKTWSFTKAGGTEGNDGELYVSNGNYGDAGCVIFTPKNIDGDELLYPYKDGDSFRVRIEGATEEPVDYTVDFVNQYREISDAKLALNARAYKFTGQLIKPDVALTYNNEPLVEGVDYELDLENNLRPGTATCTIKGLGRYKGTLERFAFDIYGDTFGFSDVEPGGWYAIDDVLGYVTTNKIMNGYSKDEFGPHDYITRGQAATVLHNLAGQPLATSEKFKDVNYGEYYGPAISWARATGVINGYGDSNTFGPNDYVTREQFATMLANYASKVAGADVMPVGEKARAMSDYSSVSSFAVPSVEWVMDHGVITGQVLADGDTIIRPAGFTERCEAAKMLAVLQRDILEAGK